MESILRCCPRVFRMKWLGLIFMLAMLFPLTGHATPPPQILDLTYAFDELTVYWPNNKNFSRDDTARGLTSQGYWYASGTFSASEHGGTHLDAPSHFASSGISIDEIPVEHLMGSAIVIDAQSACAHNPDYALTVNDIKQWEAQHGSIEPQSLIFFRTGWGKKWPDRTEYLGSPTPGDSLSLHFPGFSPEAMDFLIRQRHIRGVGIDTASIDPGQSRNFLAHQILSKANRYALENVASLEKLPPRGAMVYALPIKIKGGTGAPVRIIALIPSLVSSLRSE